MFGKQIITLSGLTGIVITELPYSNVGPRAFEIDFGGYISTMYSNEISLVGE
jgi:hypothetical protein